MNDDFGRPIDQGVATLTKAVKQIETGGDYTKSGGSGEKGAYQWMPGNFEAGAKKYGLDPSDFSPKNQDKVAYYTLLDMKTKNGYTPEQALSAWNSGGPDWEGKVGTNKYGVKYDVPAYVQKGMAAALEIKKQREANGGGQTAYGLPPAPTLPPVNAADDESAQSTGAFFPSAQGDTPLVAGAKAAGNLIPSAFGFAGGVVNSLLHPIETVKQIVQHPVESLIPEGVRQAASGIAGQITGDRIGNGADLDNAQRNFVNNPFGTVAPVVFAGRGAAGAVDSATGAIAKARMPGYVENIAENTANRVPIPQGTNFGGAFDSAISKVASPVVGAARSTFGKAGEVVRGGPKLTSEDYAGEILQGDSAMKTTGAKVLGELDTSGNKGISTYEDLVDRLGKAIEDNQTKTDAEYAKDTTPRQLPELTVRSKGLASINYVKEALKGLDEFYTKARDVESAAWAKTMTKKAKSEGLTPAEINLIAKKYGGEFGQKAFSRQTGEPLTSVNAQAYENIRTGLKSTARGFLKDDAAKTLDKNTSEMIRVYEQAKKVQEKVNSLDQRIQQRGILQKAGRLAGGALDIATGGLVRGFFQKLLLDSNRGYKSMNALNFEENLAANMKKLQYLERMNDTTLARLIVKTMSGVDKLPEPVRKAAQETVRAATVFGRPTEKTQ